MNFLNNRNDKVLHFYILTMLTELKVWINTINGHNRILHEFYSKEISSKAVIHAKSALSWQQKRTVLTQEILRVILNCSENISWEVIVQHVNRMVLRLQFSRYSQKFRYKVVKAALKAYDDIAKCHLENAHYIAHAIGTARTETK